MATETVDTRASHRRSLKVTATATIAGVGAGMISGSVASGPADQFAIAVAVGAFFVSLGIMRVISVDVDDFSAKDHLYVAFMVITLWFITWTILLTTETTPF